MRDFRELRVWEKAHEMTLTAYKATAEFPKQLAKAKTEKLTTDFTDEH